MTADGKLLTVHNPIAVPGRSMFGNWALPGREYSYISLSQLAPALGLGRTPRSIMHSGQLPTSEIERMLNLP